MRMMKRVLVVLTAQATIAVSLAACDSPERSAESTGVAVPLTAMLGNAPGYGPPVAHIEIGHSKPLSVLVDTGSVGLSLIESDIGSIEVDGIAEYPTTKDGTNLR
jgi:hypothetical protein